MYDKLPPSVKERVRRYPWKEFYFIDTHDEKKSIQRSLIERYWRYSNKFFLPDFEAGISPLDLYMITGIMCNGPEIPYNLPKWKTRWPERLPLLEQYGLSIRGEGLSVANLRDFLENYCAVYKNGEEDNPADEQDEIERVFVLWILSYSFFPNASSMAPFGFLETLENLEIAHKYDWGTPILAEIHRNLRDVSSGSSFSFDAYHHILEFWWYIHFKVNHPTLSQTQRQFPIMTMFAQGNWAPKQLTDGTTSRCVSRMQGAQRTTSTYKGWSCHQWEQWGTDPNVTEMYNKSLTRCVLYSPISKEGVWYYGERLVYQHTGVLVKAINPFDDGIISKADYERVRESLGEWETSQNDTFRLTQEATREEYIQWFRKIADTTILTELENYGGSDVPAIGRLPLGGNFLPSQPPSQSVPGESSSTQSYFYPTQPYSTDLPPFAWEVQTIDASSGGQVPFSLDNALPGECLPYSMVDVPYQLLQQRCNDYHNLVGRFQHMHIEEINKWRTGSILNFDLNSPLQNTSPAVQAHNHNTRSRRSPSASTPSRVPSSGGARTRNSNNSPNVHTTPPATIRAPPNYANMPFRGSDVSPVSAPGSLLAGLHQGPWNQNWVSSQQEGQTSQGQASQNEYCPTEGGFQRYNTNSKVWQPVAHQGYGPTNDSDATTVPGSSSESHMDVDSESQQELRDRGEEFLGLAQQGLFNPGFPPQ